MADFLDRFNRAGVEVTLVYVDMIPGDPSECRAIMGAKHFVFIPFRRSDFAFQIRRRLRSAARLVLGVAPALRALLSRKRAVNANTPLNWYFDPEVAAALARLVAERKPAWVLFNYAIFAQYAKQLAGVTRVIVDTHDRLTDRFRVVPDSPGLFSLSADDERKAIESFDVAIAIQPEEARHFANYSARIVTIGHAVVADAIPVASLQASQNVLFLGGYNVTNVATLRRIQRIWPAIARAFPAARLLVAGDIARELEPAERVSGIGRIQSLRDFYGVGRLLVNPVEFGTGLKIKNVEALAHGLPVVTTAAGAEGIPAEASGVLVAETDDAITSAIASVLRDAELTKSLHSQALSFVTRWNADQAIAFSSVFDSHANGR
jgi:glycosyltransferase involved in cell wall biosynthesis